MYYKVAERFVSEQIIKKSRFITTLIPIESAEEADSYIKELNKKYSDATHNCYAYIANDIATAQRFSDDGEPQGTAGIPMLEVLKKRQVYKTLAVVTRYFGGIKLGASGLVGAYSDGVSVALDRADVRKYEKSAIARVTAGYGIYKKLEERILSHGGKILDIQYADGVTIDFAVTEDIFGRLKEEIIDISLGASAPVVTDIRYEDYKL